MVSSSNIGSFQNILICHKSIDAIKLEAVMLDNKWFFRKISKKNILHTSELVFQTQTLDSSIMKNVESII